MSTTDTRQLLQAFAEKGSEDAFQELVARYINLVYSVALRRVGGDTHQAQDVVQTVFSDFAGKARSLSSSVQLGGWLHRHTCFVAANFTRSERRRQAREQIAVEMNTLSEMPDAGWMDVAPVLDDAIDQLEDADRHAVVLRFYEQCDLRGVGSALGIGEDAAQKRVSRALDKLREMLLRRGVTLSVAALASGLAAQAVMAAPVGLAQTAAKKSLSKMVAGAGLLAGLFGWFTPTAMKVAFCAAALVAVVATVKWQQRDANATRQATPPTGETMFAQVASADPDGSIPLTNVPTFLSTATEALSTNAGIIRLVFLAADSGRPVPNVPVDYRAWEGKKFAGTKQFFANREGVCDVPVSRATLTDLQLTTRIDGFADTRVFWRPDRGERIPTNYTVRLERSVAISGRVVDADNQPVEGAKVGWNHEADPVSEIPPQDHQFSWIEVLTDAEGRWKIDRIAPGMIRRIYGSARHSNHVSSAMVFLAKQREAEEQLREGRHVFQLGRSVSIRGIVVSPDDEPVSDARVFVGSVGSGSKREAVTGFDGSFVIAGCKPGKNPVTAEAKGFAPTTIEVQAAADSEPVRLKLERSKALLLRVVDRANRPVPGATVWMNPFDRRLPSSSNAVPVQVEFNPKTDADGRAVWEDAPDREMSFDFYAAGFMRSSGVQIHPDGQEHVVTLQPALTILGTVRDENGSLLPRFRIISGWPDGPGADGVTWSTLERFWLDFAGGEYKHTYEEPVVSGTANRGYVLKFEAEGYAPFVSRVIREDEGETRVDVVLRKAVTGVIRVLLPDGRPAKDADVGLVSVGARLQLVPGGFSRNNHQNGASLRRTDLQGRFQLPGDPGILRVIVAHPEGYAESEPAVLAGEPVMRLKPWGKIEGVYTSNGRAAPDRYVKLQLGYPDASGVITDLELFRAQTDAQGLFTFPKVPPGRHKLERLLRHVSGDTTSWMHQPRMEVEVTSGETKAVTIADTGSTVRATLRWPEGFVRDGSWRVWAMVSTPFPQPAPEVLSNPDALAKWRSSPEIQAALAASRHYQFGENGDGSWQAEDVPAGDYVVNFSAMKNGQTGIQSKDSLVGGVPLKIQADSPTDTIEVGELVLRRLEQR